MRRSPLFQLRLRHLAAAATLLAGALATINGAAAAEPASIQRLNAIAEEIPRDPAHAAAALSEDGSPAAKAWRLYMVATGALPVSDRAATIRRLAGEIEAALPDDSILKEEIRNIGDVATAEPYAQLLYLRHILSTAPDANAPCFLFLHHGEAAFEAFGAFWGSRRDERPRLCRPDPDVFHRPEWVSIASNLEPFLEPVWQERGEARYGYQRQFAIVALQASLAPRTLLEEPLSQRAQQTEGERRRGLAAFHGWKDFTTWPKPRYQTVVAALPAATAALSKVYRESFGLPRDIADSAAKVAADRFIADRAGLLSDDEP